MPTTTKASSSKQISFLKELIDSEKEKYGDRCPAGFRKLSLLGKGGIALVWMAEVKDSKLGELGSKVALKQFPKVRGQPLDNSAIVEIETGNILFPLEVKDGCEGDTSDEFERNYALDPAEFPGMRSISKLIDTIEDRHDLWLVYEVGSACLGSLLHTVKGEFYKGERIYNVAHQSFYQALLSTPKILPALIKKIAETFVVLSELSIVHSDIKPDNILVELTPEGDIKDLKLIDFGSAFSFHNVT